MEKRDLLYTGKAKSVYATDDPNRVVIAYRNDTSAFDGKKVEQLERKGQVNNRFNAYIMDLLATQGVPTHHVQLLSDTESLVQHLRMIPLECVVRNFAAGSLVRRLGVTEGQALNPPTFELFLKNDALGDPMVNESHAASFGWATAEQLAEMRRLTFRVNDILSARFHEAGMMLVDFKLEFGLTADGRLVLGDEFSPDGCRLWDKDTLRKLDKDRFRQGLGGVVEAYEEVAHRLGVL